MVAFQRLVCFTAFKSMNGKVCITLVADILAHYILLLHILFIGALGLRVKTEKTDKFFKRRITPALFSTMFLIYCYNKINLNKSTYIRFKLVRESRGETKPEFIFIKLIEFLKNPGMNLLRHTQF